MIADRTGDFSAIADAVGADTVLVLGASGGGPHARACAAPLGDRVLAAATLGEVLDDLLAHAG